MDSNIPKIQPRDQELARIQNNLANTLQGVLDAQTGTTTGVTTFSPVMQQVRGAGTPYSVKIPALKITGRPDGPFQVNQPTIVFGDAKSVSSTGVTTAQRDACVFGYGQAVWFGSAVTTDGFVIIPQVAGPAFRIAPNNASNVFQVNFDGSAGCSGPFNAATVTSAAGFKTWLPGMHYWNPNYPGRYQSLVVPVVQTANGTTSTTPWGMTMPRTGSLTAISVSQTGGSAVVCAVTVYKNGVALAAANVTSGTGSGQVSFAKGTFPFAAGDYLTAQINYSLAGVNVCSQVYLEVEEVA